MMMYSYERNGSFSDLSNASLAAEAAPLNASSADLVGRFSDLSMKSLSHFANASANPNPNIRRRCSAKLSYDSDASLGSEMSLKSGNTHLRPAARVHRRFSHTGSLGGHSYGRSSPVGLGKGRAMRRMSEMSIGEYSNATENEEKGGLIVPPQTIYTIREDESETNSIGEGMTKSYSQHSFTQAFPSILKPEEHIRQPSRQPVDPQAETKTKEVDSARHALKIPQPNLGPHEAVGEAEGTFARSAFSHGENIGMFRPTFGFEAPREVEKEAFEEGSSGGQRSSGEVVWRRSRVGEESKAEKYMASLDLEEADAGEGNAQETENIENAAAPYFIQTELVDYNGRGPYGPLEQLIILLYGYQFFYSKNVYSIVSRKMNYKRNRASVRQKLEQIVHKASGQQYGSLLNRRDEVLPILRREFWRILYDCESGSPHDQAFAAQIKKLAHEINMPEQAS